MDVTIKTLNASLAGKTDTRVNRWVCTGPFMDIKQRLKSILQEAEIYRSQGLITEAYGKYEDACDLVRSISNLKNKSSLLKAIKDKIQTLDSTKEKVEKGTGVARTI